MKYLPNSNASALRSHTTKNITVVLKGSINPFFLAVLDNLEQEINKRGFFMQLVRVERESEALSDGRQSWRQNKPAGLIFLGGQFQHKLRELHELPIPFVFCTVPQAAGLAPSKYSSVAVDDVKGIQALVKHLHNHGHRQIAFLGPSTEDRSVGALRMETFRRALHDLGVQDHPDLIVTSSTDHGRYTFGHGYDMAKELLNRKVDFTAVIAVSDIVAIGAQKALQESGLRVPEDVSITGFDGVEFANYVTPTLTTIVQPVASISAESCELLFKQIAGESISDHVLLPGILRAGGSTGPAKKDK